MVLLTSLTGDSRFGRVEDVLSLYISKSSLECVRCIPRDLGVCVEALLKDPFRFGLGECDEALLIDPFRLGECDEALLNDPFRLGTLLFVVDKVKELFRLGECDEVARNELFLLGTRLDENPRSCFCCSSFELLAVLFVADETLGSSLVAAEEIETLRSFFDSLKLDRLIILLLDAALSSSKSFDLLRLGTIF